MVRLFQFHKLLLLFVTIFYVQSSYSQTTYTVTNTALTGTGSFTEAIDLANANPGTDIIEFTPDLQIDANVPSVSAATSIMARITESVDIDGKGGALNGMQTWISAGGILNSLSSCPGNVPNTLQLAFMPGFVEIGTSGADNTGIDVSIINLTIQKFNQVAIIHKNASLVLENFKAIDTWSTYQCQTDQMIDANEGVSLTIKNSEFRDSDNWGVDGLAASIAAGPNAGDLTIEGSVFKGLSNSEQPAIFWDGATGSKVNIVSSRFQYSGGIWILGESETNIVNTIWANYYLLTPKIGDRFINQSIGDMNLIASSFVFNTNECDGLCQQSLYQNLFEINGAGNINFIESAVGFNWDPSISNELNTLGVNAGSGVFTADAYTWIQPTIQQDAAALQTITSQSSLLTSLPGFNSNVFGATVDWDIEMATPDFPGELIDVIPSGNTLTNPITGSPITMDILGNPRVDSNGDRDIGALQLALAPFLSVSARGNEQVSLSWNEPLHHDGLTIVRYEVEYDETGGSSPTTENVAVTDLTHTVLSLTNGTEYEFQVRAVYDDGGVEENGPYSNMVAATPFGSIDTPVLVATPGNSEVALSWNLPDIGGRDFDAYTIMWRIDGTTDFIGAQAIYNSNEIYTTVTGLSNGTAYEFVVTVNASGDISDQGFATATPDIGLGIDDLDLLNGKFSYYPNPVDDYLHINLDEPFQARLYSINGTLLMDVKSKKTIDISNFSSGIYTLKIQVEDKIYSGKILKK